MGEMGVITVRISDVLNQSATNVSVTVTLPTVTVEVFDIAQDIF